MWQAWQRTGTGQAQSAADRAPMETSNHERFGRLHIRAPGKLGKSAGQEFSSPTAPRNQCKRSRPSIGRGLHRKSQENKRSSLTTWKLNPPPTGVETPVMEGSKRRTGGLEADANGLKVPLSGYHAADLMDLPAGRSGKRNIPILLVPRLQEDVDRSAIGHADGRFTLKPSASPGELVAWVISPIS